MDDPPDIASSVRAALSSETEGSLAAAIAGIAESLAEHSGLDLDDLRRRDLLGAPDGRAAAVLVTAVPFGLASPLDRPRLRRDAYRYAAAAGADEGTAVAAVASALVAADLTRFDVATTAIRVRQSLLEDAPMALLDRFHLLPEDRDGATTNDDDPGATLQMALSAASWRDGQGVEATLSALNEAGPVARVLAASFAAIRSGATAEAGR